MANPNNVDGGSDSISLFPGLIRCRDCEIRDERRCAGAVATDVGGRRRLTTSSLLAWKRGAAKLRHNIEMPNVFSRGEHICALYDTEDEQLAVAAEYLADGLRLSERAFYVAESPAALARFRQALTKLSVDVTREETRVWRASTRPIT